MTTYVDNMRAQYKSMIMCHMIADTEQELLEMADTIGVKRRWHQNAGTYRSHFDVSLSMRRKAIQNGAVQITWRETVEKINKRFKRKLIRRRKLVR
jgi:Protein of unknown function (DUF4031)